MQQYNKDGRVQWGAYPNSGYSGDWYNVLVTIDGKKVDSKSQAYAPHGSISATDIKGHSGGTASVSGDVWKGGEKVLVYQMQCTLA